MSHPPQAGTTGDPATSDVAKNEATNVGKTAKDAGSHVAGTAADQAKQVTAETKDQVQDLLGQVQSQATEQARNAQQSAADSLSALGQELRSMLQSSDGSGPAHQTVSRVSDGVESLAERLQHNEPGDLVSDVRAFARRRPGAFLLGAAVAGVVAGRLTTGVVASHKDDDDNRGTGASASGDDPAWADAATARPSPTEPYVGGPPAGMPSPVDPWEDPQRPSGGGLA